MRWSVRGWRASAPDDVDRSFAALFARAGPACVRVGVEHEYRVVGTHGPADFREILAGLDVGVAYLDPRDAHGFRLPSGTWLTADEAEAEVAMPPVPLGRGFGEALAATARAARDDVRRRLPSGLREEGFSTHLNVSASGTRRDDAARLFARTFAPALMLLLDRASSPGLLVRSRPGRIELGGEYAEGGDLVSAALLAAGGVIACLRRVRGDAGARDLPDELRVEPAREWRRYGWYVSRRAFGPDLYVDGRRARFITTRGGSVSAQSQLERAWHVARRELPRDVDGADLARVGALVRGDLALPIERRPDAVLDVPTARFRPACGEVYASAVVPRTRRGFDLGAVLATWELTVFVVVDRARTRRAFACVPDAFLERFLTLLDGGALDGIVERYLRLTRGDRRLTDRAQAERPGLWDDLGARRALLRPEIRPQGTRA